jgi:hypothetical protein
VKAVRELRVAGAGGGQNAVVRTTDTSSISPTKSNQKISVGAEKNSRGGGGPANFFPGSIDVIRLYDRAVCLGPTSRRSMMRGSRDCHYPQ